MVQDQLMNVLGRIKDCCEKYHRDINELELVLVTKTVSVERINEAYVAGARSFGENRVQEFVEKKDALNDDIKWHVIGHLQTNKVKLVVGQVALIHSLDSLSLGEAIQKEAEKKDVIVPVLIQVNTSGEVSKSGFAPEALTQEVKKIVQLRRLKIQGLMTIAPLTDDEEKTRDSFKCLRQLKQTQKKHFPDEDWRYLSMGMSNDFEIAIEEGANLLRIGSAVFGPRDH